MFHYCKVTKKIYKDLTLLLWINYFGKRPFSKAGFNALLKYPINWRFFDKFRLFYGGNFRMEETRRSSKIIICLFLDCLDKLLLITSSFKKQTLILWNNFVMFVSVILCSQIFVISIIYTCGWHYCKHVQPLKPIWSLNHILGNLFFAFINKIHEFWRKKKMKKKLIYHLITWCILLQIIITIRTFFIFIFIYKNHSNLCYMYL